MLDHGVPVLDLISVGLSVGLTILVNLIYLLFSSPAPGVDV